MDKALTGIRVLDLSRVLAGPWASQTLADLGAEVIKVERPGHGDETRSWGPPWLKTADGSDGPSAYFLSCNRRKQSITIDFSQPRGQALLRELAGKSDILLENFRPGGLARYGLDHASLSTEYPELIYCSITGFGQTGPYRDRAGYDLLLQAMGGLMSITGEPESAGGKPAKVGVALTDILTGLYATIACQAALAERERSGRGQYIDLSLMDVQVATLANQAMNHLVGGQVPGRMGSAHPNIVPYQAFETADRPLVITVGNDAQFSRLCRVLGLGELADHPDYATNAARVAHREQLIPRLQAALAEASREYWLKQLETAGVPAGPVNDMAEVFADPQVQARGMAGTVPHPSLGPVPNLNNPLTRSERRGSAPPTLGEHSDRVLSDVLGLGTEEIKALRAQGVIGH